MSVYLSQYFRSHFVLLEASKLQTWTQRIENDSKAFLTEASSDIVVLGNNSKRSQQFGD